MFVIDTRPAECDHGVPLQAWCHACSTEIDDALRRDAERRVP